MRRLLLLAAAAAAVAAIAVQPADGSRYLKIGIYDEAQTLYGPVPQTFKQLGALRAQVVRLNLYWGGNRYGVVRQRPKNAADPADPAYDWDLYDRTVAYAAQYKIRVVFSIWGTPGWANGGAGANHAPRNPDDLKKFAYAAAKRYSGTYAGADGRALPAVRYWLAWNEPNNPTFLAPQYAMSAGQWVIEAADDYAEICSAIYSGVHSSLIKGELVACGVTAPRGNNAPLTARPSTSPLAFLRAVKAAGLRKFDAWAHHPYYGSPGETPTSPPKSASGFASTAITFGNINLLIRELTRLYGNKRLWITEYGYQTNPPDSIYGVSYTKQAAYLTQSFQIAKRNPRIDMMLWFLLRDEPNFDGWQSGLVTYTGKKKPAYFAFRRLRG